MTWQAEWGPFSRRLTSLLASCDRFISVMAIWRIDRALAWKGTFLPEANRIGCGIRDLLERHAANIPRSLDAVLAEFKQGDQPFGDEKWSNSDNLLAEAQRVAAKLSWIHREVDHCAADLGSYIRHLTERAFLHLNRQLVADPVISESWLEAFTTGRERAVEKKGALHLLQHGIYAFKAGAQGEATDLILSTPLRPDSRAFFEVQRAADGLVLTEWKVVSGSTAAHLKKKIDEAQSQVKLYARGSLGGLDLDGYRYLVMVSTKRLPDRLVEWKEEGITYRYLNVVISPDSPSKDSRRTASRAGGHRRAQHAPPQSLD